MRASAGIVVISLAVSGLPWSAARAADPGYCQQYASHAVAQFNQKKTIAGCVRRTANLWHTEWRWHGDYALHFAWCLGTRPAAARAEDAFREARLNDCISRAAAN